MDKKYRYDGNREFKIKKADTNETSCCPDKQKALKRMAENTREIDELQARLYAEKKEGIIFLFQAMDAAGKDGTIRAVLSCLSPHGVHEIAFKSPTSEELAHDYLWRIEKNVPMKGEIAIFNRSQYEEVLIWRVKELYKNQTNIQNLSPKELLQQRYEDIVNYEKYLYHNNIHTIKIFLNVSKEEQARRFLDRIDTLEKNWKFSAADLEERQYWDEYQKAFEDVINKTACKESPWYVVPADHKWYMRYIVSEIILDKLRAINPQYPEVTAEKRASFEQYRQKLLKEID